MGHHQLVFLNCVKLGILVCDTVLQIHHHEHFLIFLKSIMIGYSSVDIDKVLFSKYEIDYRQCHSFHCIKRQNAHTQENYFW